MPFDDVKRPGPGGGSHERAINLPPALMALIVINLAVHLGRQVMGESLDQQVVTQLGLVPANYTGDTGAPWWSLLLAPITYQFIHGGWVHLGVNMITLAAFGAPVERLLGVRRFVLFYLSAGVVAGFIHVAFFPTSPDPVVGASGAISGVFGAVLMALRHVGRLNSLLPVAGIWIALNVFFGLSGRRSRHRRRAGRLDGPYRRLRVRPGGVPPVPAGGAAHTATTAARSQRRLSHGRGASVPSLRLGQRRGAGAVGRGAGGALWIERAGRAPRARCLPRHRRRSRSILVHRYLRSLDRFARFVSELSGEQEPVMPRLPFAPATEELATAAATLAAGWRRQRASIDNLAASAQAIVDGLPDPLIAVDRQRRIVRTNRAARGAARARSLADRDLSTALRHPELLAAIDSLLATADGNFVGPDQVAVDLVLSGALGARRHRPCPPPAARRGRRIAGADRAARHHRAPPRRAHARRLRRQCQPRAQDADRRHHGLHRDAARAGARRCGRARALPRHHGRAGRPHAPPGRRPADAVAHRAARACPARGARSISAACCASVRDLLQLKAASAQGRDRAGGRCRRCRRRSATTTSSPSCSRT